MGRPVGGWGFCALLGVVRVLELWGAMGRWERIGVALGFRGRVRPCNIWGAGSLPIRIRFRSAYVVRLCGVAGADGTGC